MYTLKLILLQNFSFLGWFSFSSTVISCHQLSSTVGSWWQLTGIFVYTLKLILVQNISSIGWFSFLSAVNSCWQLFTADDSCHKKIKRIFIYPLKLKPDAQTDRRQVNIVLTPALLGWCQGLSWAIELTPALLGWCPGRSWAIRTHDGRNHYNYQGVLIIFWDQNCPEISRK